MRPDNDEYFLRIADVVRTRSTCVRRSVGCVLVDRMNFIVATAYNSVPRGSIHCIEKACAGAKSMPGSDLHLCIAQHAETLALMRCADIYKIHTCYVTASPCLDCTRRLLDTSCQRVVFIDEYPHPEARKLWERDYLREWVQHELAAVIYARESLAATKGTPATRRSKVPRR